MLTGHNGGGGGHSDGCAVCGSDNGKSDVCATASSCHHGGEIRKLLNGDDDVDSCSDDDVGGCGSVDGINSGNDDDDDMKISVKKF